MSPSAASPPPPHVLIVGTGLGGLALAQILRKRGVPTSVFERSDSGRAQGWAIGLHTILDDLVAALPDDLPPLADSVNHLRPLSLPAQMAFYPTGDPSLRLGVQDDGTGRKIIRANRSLLREYLATNIPVQYGKAAVGVEADPDGEGVTVLFKDGTSARGDIVVGADGIHSAVRQALLAGRPDPLKTVPMSFATGQVTLGGEALARQLQLGHSGYIVRHDEKNLFVGLSRVHADGKSADFYWFLGGGGREQPDTALEDGGSNPDHSWVHRATPEEFHSWVAEKSGRFDSVLSEIVRLTPVEGMVVPPIVFSSLILEGMELDSKQRRIVLLGDAAHSMTPFRGEGGVHALTDAVKLGEAIGRIADGEETREKALGEWQEEVIKRGSEGVRLALGEMNRSAEAAKERMIFGYPVQVLPPETITI